MKKHVDSQILKAENIFEDIKINGYDDKQIDELEEITKFVFMYLKDLDKRLEKIEKLN